MILWKSLDIVVIVISKLLNYPFYLPTLPLSWFCFTNQVSKVTDLIIHTKLHYIPRLNTKKDERWKNKNYINKKTFIMKLLIFIWTSQFQTFYLHNWCWFQDAIMSWCHDVKMSPFKVAMISLMTENVILTWGKTCWPECLPISKDNYYPISMLYCF